MATTPQRALEAIRHIISTRFRVGKARLSPGPELEPEQPDRARRELGALLIGGLGIARATHEQGTSAARLSLETLGITAREGKAPAASMECCDLVLRAPTDGSTDATRHLEELAAVVNRQRYAVEFNETPVRVYVPRGEYLIQRSITFTNPVELFGGGRFLLRDSSIIVAAGPRRTIIRDIMFVDDSDKPTPLALLDIVEGARCLISGAHFNGRSRRDHGSAHWRRYGLYCGRQAPFFGSLFENSYFSHCAINLRVGRQGDQTHNLYLNNTIDHASVCGVLLCNPAGGGMYGGSVEHNECESGIAIVSEAGSGLDEAKDFAIEGMYCFNNGTDSKDSVAIRIGYDVPGTAGFDDTGKGGVIRSGASAQNIRVEFNYINSPRQYRAAKIRGMSGLVVRNNNQCRQNNHQDSGEADFEFGGLCAASECRANRNMISGRFDLFAFDPENPAAPHTFINGSGQYEVA